LGLQGSSLLLEGGGGEGKGNLERRGGCGRTCVMAGAIRGWLAIFSQNQEKDLVAVKRGRGGKGLKKRRRRIYRRSLLSLLTE